MTDKHDDNLRLTAKEKWSIVVEKRPRAAKTT